MTTIAETEKDNKINEIEFNHMTKLMFNSFIIQPSKMDLASLEKKSLLLSYFTEFVNKIVE